MDELIVSTDFSGLGSAEEALKRINVKHKIAFACDNDKYVKKSYLSNHQPDIFFDDIVLRDQSKAPKSDLYVFGFPCQTFSMAGNRKGFEDTRGTLIHNSASYIKEKQPRAFLGENVKGLFSHDKVKGSKSKYGRTFGVIRDLFGKTVNGQQNLYKYDDCLNYHIHFFILNTKHFGIPQNRERIFLIGFRDEEDSIRFRKPKPFQLKKMLKDLLEDKVDEKFYLSDKMVEHLLKNSKRNRIIKSTDNISPTLLANQAKQSTDSIFIKELAILSMRGRNIVNGKRKDYKGAPTVQRLELNTEGISNTITTVQKDNLLLLFDAKHDSNRVYDSEGIARKIKSSAGGGGALTGLYRVYENNSIESGFRIRRLTPRECFRLMGFSDEFFDRCASINSDTQLYKQAGNSIVVDTIMHLLIQILTAMNIPFKYPNDGKLIQ